MASKRIFPLWPPNVFYNEEIIIQYKQYIMINVNERSQYVHWNFCMYNLGKKKTQHENVTQHEPEITDTHIFQSWEKKLLIYINWWIITDFRDNRDGVHCHYCVKVKVRRDQGRLVQIWEEGKHCEAIFKTRKFLQDMT